MGRDQLFNVAAIAEFTFNCFAAVANQRFKLFMAAITAKFINGHRPSLPQPYMFEQGGEKDVFLCC